MYLSHHMFAIDERFKTTNCCTLCQREDILGLDGHSALIGVLLENDDLGGRNKSEMQFLQSV